MNDSQAQPSRLVLFRVLLKCMAWLAVIAVVVVVLQSMINTTPEWRDRASALIVPLEDQAVGELRSVDWQGRPVLVLRLPRSWQEHLAGAQRWRDLLVDPDGSKSVQPALAEANTRSVEVGWFVVLGVGTGLGCPLRLQPPSDEQWLRDAWPGGFIDTCDNSRFDLAGRVFRGQYATKNLIVPPWYIKPGGDQLVIGASSP